MTVSEPTESLPVQPSLPSSVGLVRKYHFPETGPYDSLGAVRFGRRTSMRRIRQQYQSEIGQTIELGILESTEVTSVPRGRGAGLIDALTMASSPSLAQRRLAVLDAEQLRSGSSMFDYDRSTGVSLAGTKL